MESLGPEQAVVMDTTASLVHGSIVHPTILQHQNQNRSTTESDSYKKIVSCFVAGGMSSSIRWLLTPLEIVKTQMQLSGSAARTKSSWTVAQNIVQTHGVRGLFRGIFPTAMSYGTQTSIKYGVYEYLKQEWGKNTNETSGDQWQTHLAAAFVAEALADVFMCPWENWRVRVQAGSTAESTTAGIMQSWSSTLGPLWARQIPGTMANFVCFEAIMGYVRRNNDQPPSMATTIGAGFCAGACNAIVSHPADAVLSLRATASTTLSISTLVATHGLGRLATRGLGPRVLLTSHVIALQWLLYEQGKLWLCGPSAVQ